MKTKPGQITWRSAAGLAAVGSILVSGIGMETRASPSAPSALITKGRLEQAAPAATMPASTTVADKANQARLIESYGKLPLAFERNQGQTDAHVRFLSRGDGYSLFLTPNEAVLSLQRASAKAETGEGSAKKSGQRETAERAVLRMKLLGANSKPRITGIDPLSGKSNYFIGNDPGKWHTDVPTYAKVQYYAVYPGVDLVYYGNRRHLEYDFTVAPGGDPTAIRLAFAGVDNLEVSAAGDLLLSTPAGQFRQHRPVLYQEVDGVRNLISGRYVLFDPETPVRLVPSTGQGPRTPQVGFQVGTYNPEKPLIIDPVLSYSTYLGGADNDAGNGIAVDQAGNAYVVGRTESVDFPVTAGSLQPTTGGGSTDAFVTKLNPAGSAFVYSTYLGGPGLDIGNGIAVDQIGNAYVTGQASTDFPTVPVRPVATSGLSDIFVAKLAASGSVLSYSTPIGGDLAERGNGIAVDGNGSAHVAGTRGGVDDFGDTDVLVAKLTPDGSALVYGGLLGGSGISKEEGRAIAVDAAGNAYVTGFTESGDFLTLNALQLAKGNFRDAFVAKLDPTGLFFYSTYLGGNGSEEGTGIAADATGNAYVTGLTRSSDFPTANAIQPTLGSSLDDAFVTALNPAGSALVYSTYLGGSGNDRGLAVAVDGAGSAYVTGFTRSPDFPTANAIQPTLAGDSFFFPSDAFVTKFHPSGSPLVYSTFLGGGGDSCTVCRDVGNGIAVDTAANAYVTGSTLSPDFPVVNALQPQKAPGPGAPTDAFVTKIADTAATSADLSVTISDSPDPVVVGRTLIYTLTVANNGPAAAAGVALTDTLPSGVTLVSANGCSGTGTLSCSIGSLARGARATVTITVKPNAAGALGNSVHVRASQSDPNAANNTATAATTVQASADLRVTATDSPDPVTVGRNLSYKATVTNKGPSTASASKLTDTLPTSLTFVSASTTKGSCSRSGRTVTCNLGSLAKDARATVTIVVKPKTKGTISNTIKVASGVADAVSSNNTAKPSTTVQ